MEEGGGSISSPSTTATTATSACPVSADFVWTPSALSPLLDKTALFIELGIALVLLLALIPVAVAVVVPTVRRGNEVVAVGSKKGVEEEVIVEVVVEVVRGAYIWFAATAAAVLVATVVEK